MKLVTYKTKKGLGSYRMGVLFQDNIYDLNEVYRQFLHKNDVSDVGSAEYLLPSDPTRFFELGHNALDRSQEAFSFLKEEMVHDAIFEREDVILGPPVLNPSKIICVGKNYKEHVAEMKSEIPDYPVLFAKFSNALIGPEDFIQKSPKTDKLDYEVELAVVIGKEASQVSKEEALDYIAGYTIGNDVSARDLQKRTPQWLQGKTLDHSTPIGPWMVTTDEIPDPSNLEIKSYVNGEERQSSNTKHLIFDIPFLIEFVSGLITLQPGDVILTGTPDGVGFAMDPPTFLQDGDTVTLKIEEIGILQNQVKA
ncbi:fumarylacetoacetate hydrolase family protein [Radiobacillus kanasensis]|uniref:fumarylacetoacetate hydrolase family protein n=1 Tax=Radiobacillus kanasensis TaxID=2844358 RepID=UPI001E3A9803|nr:fumarylacetoacetate hydrolase family protein [Radiobacillus kanasensis]UFU01458.1 fumarylacetoacetate hydrolase family protein [Radiobacillus kanasensis]